MPHDRDEPLGRAKRRALKLVEAVHQAVNRDVAPLLERHASRLNCRAGCSDCCVDDLSVFEVEADRIRSQYGAWLETAVPHAPGACAFLDEVGRCRIYDARPYVCRTQGLPLRWFEENEAEEIVEQRDICPLNAEGDSLETLSESELWQLGLVEQELLQIQHQLEIAEQRSRGAGDTSGEQKSAQFGVERRIRLRDLFERSG